MAMLVLKTEPEEMKYLVELSQDDVDLLASTLGEFAGEITSTLFEFFHNIGGESYAYRRGSGDMWRMERNAD